jgi:hypothetical protein
LLDAVSAEDASDSGFCETSNETVPVGKSSANKSEADLPKLPEKLMGAPNANAAEKMPIRAVDGCSFGRDTLRFCFAGCSNANCFLHNLLGMAMHAGRQLSVEAQTEQERFRG